MQKFIFLLCILVPFMCRAQVFQPAATSNFTAFDTNGPVGKCLFPEDDKLQEVISCELNKEEIADAIQAWSNRIELLSNKRISVNHFEKTGTQITFDVQLYIGSTKVDIPWVGEVEKQYSEVKYKVFIELKDQKFRVTFFQFYTDRVTIRGEAKSNGPSNMIHWQRLNSLKAERKDVIGGREKLSSKRQREVNEYNSRISQEEAIYKEEWETVCAVMKDLKGCVTPSDDF